MKPRTARPGIAALLAVATVAVAVTVIAALILSAQAAPVLVATQHNPPPRPPPVASTPDAPKTPPPPPPPPLEIIRTVTTPVTGMTQVFGIDLKEAPEGTQFRWQYSDASGQQWTPLSDWAKANWESSSWVTFNAPQPGDYQIQVNVKTPDGRTADATTPWTAAAPADAVAGTTCQSAGPAPDLTTADKVVSAVVNLNGSGSGFQGKVMMSSGDSAVSFGLQYDTLAVGGAAYRRQAAFLSENVSVSNKSYVYKDWCIGALGTDTRVMLAYFSATQTVSYYVEGVYIGSQPTHYDGSGVSAVEGDVKHNGDMIDVNFSYVLNGIKGSFNPGAIMGTQGAPGVGIAAANDSTLQNLKLHITGTAVGFQPGKDWDSSPGAAAAIVLVYTAS